MLEDDVRSEVQKYYGKTLQSNEDLKTNACCLPEAMPAYLKDKLDAIHPEILDKFYGCGSPIPFELEGKTVLDLGCGTGRDCYLLSQLVGESGQVIGVDMTEEQLSVARKYQVHHKEKFGYNESNIKFLHGYIEDLETLEIASDSVDVVISNCVINLSPNKEMVFKEIFRVLKPSGELYYSDVFSDRRLPESCKTDPVLVGECLGGALYYEDFRRLLVRLGCLDYRTVKTAKIRLDDTEIKNKLSDIQFYSLTVRAFKLGLEDRCEDYGHQACYQGTLSESPDDFILDDHHSFLKGEWVAVCGNTYLMLQKTRYAKHFQFKGDFSTHKGLFDCSPAEDLSQKAIGACC